MVWDLGVVGVGLLAGMALAFGVLAELVAGRGRTTRWLWLIASASYFAAGLFVSEVMFGYATEAELQPNIDGLSFDEVALGGLIVGAASVLIARYVSRRRRGGHLHARADRERHA